MSVAPKEYNAKNITALEGLEPVRKRPGMYIGGVGSAGLHHLIWEIVDNSVDEAMNGHASEIVVTLHKDGETITVSDNGRGIPVDKHPKTKKSALEMVLTVLHAGGKFEGDNYKTSGGLHGVGASVVNALSKELVAVVKRNGAQYRMAFSRGQATSKLQKLRGTVRGTGTTITFTPDPTIFPRTTFNTETIKQRLETASFLHRGVKVTYVDEVAKTRETFLHENGIVDYLGKVIKEREARTIHEAPFTYRIDEDNRVEATLQWTESTDEHVRSYVNGIPTASGGTHENGFRGGVVKAVRNHIDTHNLTPRGVKITHEDIREGLIAIVSIFVAEPQFQGQTKDRLNNPEAHGIVESGIRGAMEQWLNNNPSVADAVIARIVAAARARAASRAASEAVSRKGGSKRTMLPGKLSDCVSGGKGKSELFIVEGDSAGGSAKQGRDRNCQAILPLRGKVLNTESATLKKILDNKEIQDMIASLGCGIGPSLNLANLRYDRIILLADADSDGHHITTLLLTFFYRHMPALIADGRLFIAVPPLYRIDIGKETFWAADEEDRERILSEHTGRANPEITRFKGLGEMMPKVLWNTTLDPANRTLLKVEIDDHLETDRTISDLMGRDASARFRFIMERAEDASEIDI
ncbi:type IIA DNA topoisomerase subunit B [Rhodopirellula sp. JC740]|uniref:DNA topoisomerase (ATP-hydrolyzing) n=1 Tax=Rhodopirellula halodulae TaxID=2894198 RepID=A0ABS8NNH5_9BACT|nr:MULTISPECIES: DNA topoisomerase IV subunit B [unclassified Rhodopirellula]MCC9645121.1 type IIA DNA topoisomerase subunit B [Rhodopirellula sp. JC740]MCC9658687.1 type IIA DNA topoisomerase subunit B [Rhodopirellula sp. JC737]